MVLLNDVELVAAAYQHFGKDCVYVDVHAYEEAVMVFDDGVAPVDVAVEWVINGGVGEVGEFAVDVGGD
jgi:hypothetical protein